MVFLRRRFLNQLNIAKYLTVFCDPKFECGPRFPSSLELPEQSFPRAKKTEFQQFELLPLL